MGHLGEATDPPMGFQYCFCWTQVNVMDRPMEVFSWVREWVVGLDRAGSGSKEAGDGSIAAGDDDTMMLGGSGRRPAMSLIRSWDAQATMTTDSSCSVFVVRSPPPATENRGKKED